MENGKPDLTSDEVAPDESAVNDLAVQLETITMERDRLLAEKEDLQGRILRRQADFENLRRRTEKERAEVSEYAAMEAVRSLLPVLDDFERALKAMPESTGPEAEWLKGVQMIYQRLSDSLQKLGLEPLDSVGKPFDPNVHHAVETVPTTEAEDHTVLEEFQKGYNFKGRLLREAMVRVAVTPPDSPAGT
jgi:molecular chaperone GrpE